MSDTDRLREFAAAMARRDRSRHRHWLPDAEIEGAIRGYAYAAAIAERRPAAVPFDAVDAAISAYRRERRLPKRAGAVSAVRLL